jgi:hypothetical protein
MCIPMSQQRSRFLEYVPIDETNKIPNRAPIWPANVGKFSSSGARSIVSSSDVVHQNLELSTSTVTAASMAVCLLITITLKLIGRRSS